MPPIKMLRSIEDSKKINNYCTCFHIRTYWCHILKYFKFLIKYWLTLRFYCNCNCMSQYHERHLTAPLQFKTGRDGVELRNWGVQKIKINLVCVHVRWLIPCKEGWFFPIFIFTCFFFFLFLLWIETDVQLWSNWFSLSFFVVRYTDWRQIEFVAWSLCY